MQVLWKMSCVSLKLGHGQDAKGANMRAKIRVAPEEVLFPGVMQA